jgi:hypothetical protein
VKTVAGKGGREMKVREMPPTGFKREVS